MHLTVRSISSLEKVFPHLPCDAPAFTTATALRGEEFSYQLLCTADTDGSCAVRVDTPLAVSLFHVECIPAKAPYTVQHDDNYITTEAGLFPDLLRPLDGAFALRAGEQHAVWVSVRIPEDAPAGTFPIAVTLTAGGTAVTASFSLTVLPVALPPQTLWLTQWMHYDCIATYYKLPVFSEEHWQKIEQFLRVAVDHGQTMLLTPIFTPALDTEIGKERPTVQLMDVERTENGYRFGFDRLRRFLALARKCGIRQFEIAHLFTQWGAKAAPKVVDVHGTRLFGWDTPALSEEYQGFLRAMLPALTAVLLESGKAEDYRFHISDEPHKEEDMLQYKQLYALVKPLIPDFLIMDAMSAYDLYEAGVVDRPVVALNAAEPFLANHVPDLWLYYCCAQGVQVSNRFFAMPSARNRILGTQLFLYDIAGFLHWGFNFYYLVCSAGEIDPFQVSDAGGLLPAGDPFVVYPGENEVLLSLRLKVFKEALQDLRALQLLAAKRGADAAKQWLLDTAGAPLTLTEYPKDPAFLLRMRQELNRLLAE